ncbi:unnamed protein product [Lasius platythorax]|uniref:Uncharacterized protein n=1 Tax=Lasius platythorax TaxID=488582 RepID=A0AAV2N6G3_9HYME
MFGSRTLDSKLRPVNFARFNQSCNALQMKVLEVGQCTAHSYQTSLALRLGRTYNHPVVTFVSCKVNADRLRQGIFFCDRSGSIKAA